MVNSSNKQYNCWWCSSETIDTTEKREIILREFEYVVVELRRGIGFKLCWIWKLKERRIGKIKDDNRNLIFNFWIGLKWTVTYNMDCYEEREKVGSLEDEKDE